MGKNSALQMENLCNQMLSKRFIKNRRASFRERLNQILRSAMCERGNVVHEFMALIVNLLTEAFLISDVELRCKFRFVASSFSLFSVVNATVDTTDFMHILCNGGIFRELGK